MKKEFLKYLGLLGMGLFMVGCSQMSAPAPQQSKTLLPAITSEDTQRHYQGKFVWHDLLTDDVTAAKTFYAGLFGWSFQDYGDYVVILNQGRRIGGMITVVPKDSTKAEALWLASVSVADVDKAATYVQEHHGAVLKGPMDMTERGRGALVSDADGAHLVLLHSKSGDPVDAMPQNGDWLWNELWSNHLDQSYTFYQALIGYDKTTAESDYLILTHEGQWRAGIREVKDDDSKVRWVPVIRVADPEATAAKATQFGGRVLLEPQDSFKNGDVAVIIDPSGALVIIQRWSDEGAES
jgi:predicted enzyme related to lactoylglutathione lyase